MILSERPNDDDSQDGFTKWPFMTTHTWAEYPRSVSLYSNITNLEGDKKAMGLSVLINIYTVGVQFHTFNLLRSTVHNCFFATFQRTFCHRKHIVLLCVTQSRFKKSHISNIKLSFPFSFTPSKIPFPLLSFLSSPFAILLSHSVDTYI